MGDGILHERLGETPWMAAHTLRLPGTTPIDPQDWLRRDEVFAAQMAERDRLVATAPERVHALEPAARPAAEELRDLVLSSLDAAPGYAREGEAMRRPDGVRVPLDGEPLLVAGRLVQEDLVLMDRAEGEAEHRLVGAVLCFPSNWTLAQKFGMPLGRIHLPVAQDYDADVARRVQRLFDAVQVGRPLMRANLVAYDDARLHNPRPEFERHRPEAVRVVRSERQVILRLPRTRACVFSIHTYQVPFESIGGEERERLRAVRPHWFEGPA